MRVVEIRNDSELQALRTDWEMLLRQSASQTIFLTWEWISAWWSSYGTPGELRILAAYDDCGALRGIAPLRSGVLRKYGAEAPELLFIGDGSDDSDYLDFLIASGYERQVMDAFQAHWRPELKRGTTFALNEIPDTSPNLPLLREVVNSQRLVCVEAEVPCATVRMPQNWDAYLSTLRPRFRTKVRSVLRNLESRPEVQFAFCENQDQARRLLPILFDLHAKRWALKGKPGVFGWSRKRDFYFALSSLLLERGSLRFSWLEWNGQVLACQYGFIYGNTYFHLQEGYEPACEHWNIGIGLRAWSFRELLKQGIGEYDFLGGAGRHKTDWGAEVKYSRKMLMARWTLRNVGICRGPEWANQLRESVKRFVPARILAARHARMERQDSAASGRQAGHRSEMPERDWARRAAANFYFHCKFPALARPLRDRYQLSASPGSRWPGISLNRRTSASARILYYHRVNDNKDPFSPAISTELFERQMRFLVRYYKVVALSELLDRVGENSSEPVIAITFDDGYQDNYEHAFPILRRYNLPATIFLTTGSIDTRKLLWFEELAQAIKNSPLEFLDVEIDLPRRFWLRTERERLDCNAQLFQLMRRLPDSGRRQLLAHVLRQLAIPSSEPNGNALTWDQARLMQKHGIDFGGHTVTHPFLSKLTGEQLVWEVSECKRRIEEELQRPIAHFAYPNGRDEDFCEWNSEAIRKAGYRAAATTIWGVNDQSTDPMQLRRGGPWEETPALFAYKLDWYQLTNG